MFLSRKTYDKKKPTNNKESRTEKPNFVEKQKKYTTHDRHLT